MKVAAADLGATSGRIVVVDIGAAGPTVSDVTRFRNGARLGPDGLWEWPIEELYEEVMSGLQQAREMGAQSWGIDSWGVDYGVVLPGAPLGERVGPVVSHRDPRHAAGMSLFEGRLPWEQLYAIGGIQRMDINTVYQLAAESPSRVVEGSVVLLIPDLISYWATGILASDVTDASTSGMVDVSTRQWSPRVIDALGLPRSAFLSLQEPGIIRGASLHPRLGGLPLIGVGTHDTASAFVGTPIGDRDEALILSLGTWALIGAEVVGRIPSDHAREHNLTHELGVDGTVRFLGNVTGMWLLEECRRAWAATDGAEPSIADLVGAAAQRPAFAALFDVDDPELERPGQNPHTIGQHVIGSNDVAGWSLDRGAVVRAILESLVIRLAHRAREVEEVLGAPRATLHVVGGATRIPMLMQWLADAMGKNVVAGPVEATALGNALVQWQAVGVIGDLAEGRALVSGMPEIRTYEPAGDASAWDAAAARLKG